MGDILPLAFLSPSPGEMLLVAVIALLLFGGNLPEVAKSWGKTFAEFRRSLQGIQNDINEAIYTEPDQLEYRADLDAAYVDPDYPEADDYSEPEDAPTVASADESVASDDRPRD